MTTKKDGRESDHSISAGMHPEEIKAQLRMSGHTLAALADELKRSRTMVSQVVLGNSRSKDIEARIAEILGKPIDEIWKAKPTLRRANAASVGQGISDTFLQRLLRLKSQLNVGTDAEVAAALGYSPNAFNDRKARDAFPVDRLHAVAQQCPELGIDVDYVLTGESKSSAVAAVQHSFMGLHEVAHALNRVAPAMESGFVIQTGYGDLAIAPGPLAEQMRDLLAQHAQRELTHLAAQEGANHG